MTKYNFPSLTSRLAIGILLAFSGLWAPYIHLFYLNAGNFTLPFLVHLPLLAALSIGIIGISFLLQSYCPSPIRYAASSILLFVGVYLWAEGTLFIGNFGFLQGGEMDWEKNQHLLYLELSFIAVGTYLFFRFKRLLPGHALTILLLIFVSSMANIYPAFKADNKRTKTTINHTFTKTGVHNLSPHKNVIIFIVDTFQSDVFAELLAEEPELKKVFDGFTYFPNATSAFPKTYASVPNILTGKAFDNSQPFPLFMEKSYLGNSAPKILKQNGFDVRFKTLAWQPYLANPEIADNLTSINSEDDRKWMQQKEFNKLTNLTLFRLSPFLAKPWVYNDNEFRIKAPDSKPTEKQTIDQLSKSQSIFSSGNTSKDLKFHDEMMAFLNSTSDKPTFRVFHFQGVHAPLNFDRNLKYIGKQANNRHHYREQAIGVINLLKQEFTHMKDIGAFHNSLIFIIGDHGCGEYSAVGFNNDAINSFGLDIKYQSEGDSVEEKIIRGGVPLMLVKKFKKSNPMEVSKSPVELGDIPNTIFNQLHLNKPIDGPSMFEIPESSERIRYHKYYQFSGWGQDYIVPLNEFKISGFSWDPKSWSLTGRDLNQMAIDAVDGELVILGESGNLNKFINTGWATPRVQGRQIANKMASVSIPITTTPNAIMLEVRTRPYLQSPSPETMTVLIDNSPQAVWSISKSSPVILKTLFPKHLYEGKNSIDLQFQMDNSEDTGPFIIEIFINYNPGIMDYGFGDPISFLQNQNSTEFLTSGWAPAEKWGTWTLGHRAAMVIKLQEPPSKDVQASIHFRPAVFTNASPLLVDVLANGETIATWSLSKKGWQSKNFIIPQTAFLNSKNLELIFSVDNPRAPGQFNSSGDTRLLGLGLESLVLSETTTNSTSKKKPFSNNLILENNKESKSKGLHDLENWNGTPTVWTNGKAHFKFDTQKLQQPKVLLIEVFKTRSKGSTITISVNGHDFVTNQFIQDGWIKLIDISSLPQSDEISIQISSDTFSPVKDNPNSPDHRTLGVALRQIILIE